MKNLDRSIIQLNGQCNLQFTLRPSQKLVGRCIQAESLSGLIELLLGDLERIQFCHISLLLHCASIGT